MYSMRESHNQSKPGFRSHLLLIGNHCLPTNQKTAEISAEKPYSANNIRFHHLFVNDRQRAFLRKVIIVEDLLTDVKPPFQQGFQPTQIVISIKL